MGTPPANAMTITNSPTHSLGLPLSDPLLDLLMSGDRAVVGPKTAAELRLFSAQPEPPPPSKDDVEKMIGALSLATAKAKTSPQEAAAQHDLYWLALKDIPLADLRAAFAGLVRTATFMPKPAEIRAAALRPGSRRRYARSRAQHLVWLHEHEWEDPAPVAPPDEVRALLTSVAASIAVPEEDENRVAQ